MAYSFSDITGNVVGDGPSINGLRELKAFVQEQGAEEYPSIGHLFEHGYTKRLLQLGKECRSLAKRATNKDIKITIVSLGKSATKAKELLIMEDA
jgi:hypothetical protein